MILRGRCLSRLLEDAGVRPLQEPGADPEIKGICLDSRRASPGDLFCALVGLKADGTDFIPEALRRGARAVLSESPRPGSIDSGVAWLQVAHARRATGLLAREWHGRPDEGLTLVGITGTNGKTSVVYLLEAIARAAGRRPGRIGTVSYAYRNMEWPAGRTTPEAPELFALLASMKKSGVDLAVLEVSSHAEALGRVEGARFAMGGFLNLSRDHLDFHGDMESYFAAKARLIEGLDARARAVLPADETWSLDLASRTSARVIEFGRSERAAVRIVREQCRLDRTEVELETPAGTLTLESPLAGAFTPDNLAAAVACSLGLGLSPEAIAEGIEAVKSVPGRMERVDHGQPFTLLVDYVHTEDALARLLTGVKEMSEGRVLVVFGCGGERDRGKRPLMGRVAAETANLLFLTSDNPRGEDPLAILREIEGGVAAVPSALERCRTLPDRAGAVREAVRAAGPGDVVVIAGKGHETSQVFGDRTEHLDDREVAREVLTSEGWKGGCRASA